MSQKILITYASRTGTTAGVAEEIGRTLSGMGEAVEVLPVNEVGDVTSYKAVIAGSAIQSARWLPEAIEFVKNNKVALSQRPFASFLVCMTLAMPKAEKYSPAVKGWLMPVRSVINPVSEGLFAGSLRIDKIPSFTDRIKFRFSVLLGVWKEGDHRDKNAIAAWAASLKPLFDRFYS